MKVIFIENSTYAISTFLSTPNKLGSNSNGIKKQMAGGSPNVAVTATL
jgi:hypothetical protein